MRARRVLVACAAALLAAAGLPSQAAGQSPPGPEWSTYTPAIGGQSGYHDGEFVYQDFVYDDAGARTNVPAGGGRMRQHGVLSSPRGSFRYPTNAARYGANAADILVVRARATDDHLHMRVQLNTMLVPDAAVVGVVFGISGESTRRAWPRAAGISTPGTVAVTAWGSGGEITDMTTGTSTPIADAGGAVTADLEANTIDVTIPRSAVPDGDELRTYLASGIWDGAAGAWMSIGSGRSESRPGGGSASVPRLWNVAFRSEPVDTQRRSQSWFEDHQADALAAGNIDAFFAILDLSKMASGATEHPPLPRGDVVEAIYEASRVVPPGEGVSEEGVEGRGESDYQGANFFNYLGRHQPYALYVPAGLAEPAPLALVLHGGSANHMAVVNGDGAHRDLAEAHGRVLASPLCRGPNCQYADYGELDVLEVMADVTARVAIDPARVTLSGYSMGGYGTYRIGSRHPDLFSSAVVWAGRIGRPTDGNGHAHLVLENFANLPAFLVHGALDELEPLPTTAVPVAARLDELGYEHAMRAHPAAEHITYGVLDTWVHAAAWMAGHVRNPNPRVVRFRAVPSWDGPLPELRADRAYWVSDIGARQESTQEPLGHAFADVTAVAGTLLGSERAGERTLDAGLDDVGPYVETGRTAGPASAQIARELGLVLRNTASLAIDLRRIALDDGARFCLRFTSDGPVQIELRGRELAAASDQSCSAAAAVQVAASAGATVVHGGTGDHAVALAAPD